MTVLDIMFYAHPQNYERTQFVGYISPAFYFGTDFKEAGISGGGIGIGAFTIGASDPINAVFESEEEAADYYYDLYGESTMDNVNLSISNMGDQYTSVRYVKYSSFLHNALNLKQDLITPGAHIDDVDPSATNTELSTAVNTILARLEAAGILATS